jgi:hypothetical protein
MGAEWTSSKGSAFPCPKEWLDRRKRVIKTIKNGFLFFTVALFLHFLWIFFKVHKTSKFCKWTWNIYCQNPLLLRLFPHCLLKLSVLFFSWKHRDRVKNIPFLI